MVDWVTPSWRSTLTLTVRITDLDSAGRCEDARLIEQMQTGNQQALSCLFDRYAVAVFGIGRRVLDDAGEAEELVQDVFLKVYRRCSSFDASKGTVSGWLRRIAYREALDRRSYLRNHRFYVHDELEKAANDPRLAFDMEREVNSQWLRSNLENAIAALNDKQRATLRLCFLEGYTLREVSQLTKESLVNTRHHYYRALERLRRNFPAIQKIS